MRILVPVVLAALLFAVPAAAEADRFAGVDEVVNAGISRGDCPGAVVLVLHRGKVVYRKAFGRRSVQPEPAPMTAPFMMIAPMPTRTPSPIRQPWQIAPCPMDT